MTITLMRNTTTPWYAWIALEIAWIHNVFFSIVTFVVLYSGRFHVFRDPVFVHWRTFAFYRCVATVSFAIHWTLYLLPMSCIVTLDSSTSLCTSLLGAVSTLGVVPLALNVFFLCIYQLFVVFFPNRYFIIKNHSQWRSFHRLLDFFYHFYALYVFSLYITHMNNGRCHVLGLRPRPPLYPLPYPSVRAAILTLYYALAGVTALLYTVLGIVLIARHVLKLNADSAIKDQSMCKVVIVGLLSFVVSYLRVYLYVYVPAFSGEYALIYHTWTVADFSTDFYLHLWKNTAFRQQLRMLFKCDRTTCMEYDLNTKSFNDTAVTNDV